MKVLVGLLFVAIVVVGVGVGYFVEPLLTSAIIIALTISSCSNWAENAVVLSYGTYQLRVNSLLTILCGTTFCGFVGGLMADIFSNQALANTFWQPFSWPW